MLRGVVDYLVKPDESVGQKQVEASSENDATSNHSIGCLAGVQKIRNKLRKGVMLSNPSVFENHFTQERTTFWHPNSSVFKRYTSRVSQPLQSTLMSVCDHNKYSETNSEKIFANIISEYNSNIPSPTPTSQRSMIPLPLEPLVN
ncbi:hypothetical protein V6N12_037651 [Hibiscus sabdariffa]|uniref:Uncharacterized protein n=1 Tax=Hibiscus sabdariffa TaxID=183260 RepID=A0ABR2C2S9_9ROSI